MRLAGVGSSCGSGTARKAQNSERKGNHGNEGANLWYRPMAVLILLVSIVYSTHSAEPFKPQHASQNHCKKTAPACQAVCMLQHGPLCGESELPYLYAVDCKAYVTLPPASYSCQ